MNESTGVPAWAEQDPVERAYKSLRVLSVAVGAVNNQIREAAPADKAGLERRKAKVVAEGVKWVDLIVASGRMEKCPTCKDGEQELTVETVGSGQLPTRSKIRCVVCDGFRVVPLGTAKAVKAQNVLWCRCGNPSQDIEFHDDGECEQCDKHHYHCADCGKITQVG